MLWRLFDGKHVQTKMPGRFRRNWGYALIGYSIRF